jgi:hypothetical protein
MRADTRPGEIHIPPVEPGTATEHPLRCVECCLTITGTAAGWRAYLIDLRG